ncbi:putative leucine-rich repeat domain superfamily, F-box-like domain superfamily [Helianthus debilis subsp. tardiflorus]
MDRISQLPDFIVHHILSFLHGSPPAELVRMSVLSKTWFHLTASFPQLDFSIHKFGSRESFFKYVEYTTSRFCHQNLTAHRLTLHVTIRNPAELDIVNRCLGLLLMVGVNELSMSMSMLAAMPKYRLPNTLLSVSVLKSLSIYNCGLPSSLMHDGVVKFKSLISLQLHNVRIDEEVIRYITTGCPLLQWFEIRCCYGFKRFCVYQHQNLQRLGLVGTSVEIIDIIEAPNLYNFYLAAKNAGRRPPKLNLASCKKLTSVTYEGYPSPNSNGFLSNFPFVENLDLFTTCEGNNLKLSSHSLRTLELFTDFDLEKIELSTPNLDLFIYCNDDYGWVGVRQLPHLKACMGCYPDGSIDTAWFQKLRLFLDKKNGFKASNLYICTDQVRFFNQTVYLLHYREHLYKNNPNSKLYIPPIPFVLQKFIVLENIKEIELPPFELEHLELHFEHEESLDHAAFVDAVLCCFRPRFLTLRSSFPLTDSEEQSALVKILFARRS